MNSRGGKSIEEWMWSLKIKMLQTSFLNSELFPMGLKTTTAAKKNYENYPFSLAIRKSPDAIISNSAESTLFIGSMFLSINNADWIYCKMFTSTGSLQINRYFAWWGNHILQINRYFGWWGKHI